jgi:Flp pilus assembly protein TadG
MLRLGRDQSGASAVEFGLIAPVLLLMLAGIIDFGLTLNNYLELTDAVRVGARQFAIAGSTATPKTTATTALKAAAANLTGSSITITYSVNGTACTSDATCQTALAAAAGKSATVTATYPCSAPVAGITILASCTLTSTTAEMIE